MDDSTFFRGVDAVEMGFADIVIDNPEAEAQIAAMLDFDEFAAQTKEKEMSATNKLKTVMEERDTAIQEANAKADALEIVEGQLESAKAEIEQLKQAHAAEMKAINDAITEKNAAYAASLEALQQNITELTERANTVDSVMAELDSLKQTVANNPAMAQAALEDVSAGQAPNAAVDAEAERAEQQAAAVDAENEPHTYLEAYERMPAGDSRTAFWRANKRLILNGARINKEDNDNA